MCGFAGLIDHGHALAAVELKATAEKMAQTLTHRGPDDGGVWVDSKSGAAIGFQRLSIIDLSQEGHQPMISTSTRYVLAFNGELYNFQELRRELHDWQFRGRSDTEVFLAAFEQWGLERTLARARGMFAFALWDAQRNTLHLGRDRIGEKPLYYQWTGNTLIFGSELKALRASDAFNTALDGRSVQFYLRYGYIPAPKSIYQATAKVQPGTVISFCFDDDEVKPTTHTYWNTTALAVSCSQSTDRTGADAAVDELDSLLRDVIRDQMISDVPLGAFLSGGIDSSTVVGIMQRLSSQPVKTFTVGFAEQGFNEAEPARQVAEHLGTDHTELYVTARDAAEVIPLLPTIYDEPLSDVSQIPTFLVSSLARRHVTVCLTGDGGDEIFGGYRWYRRSRAIWRYLQWIPLALRQRSGRVLTSIGSRAVVPLMGARAGAVRRQAGAVMRIWGEAENISQVQQLLLDRWHDEPLCPTDNLFPPIPCLPFANSESALLLLDQLSFLPDNQLMKVDRASMRVGLEARLPFLDPRVVEFAWRTPLKLKIKGDCGKAILRQVLYRYVPKELVDRPKNGFGVPLGLWLRGPLRDWAESMLTTEKLTKLGGLEPSLVRRRWQEHLAGAANRHHELWHVLTLAAWLEHHSAS